MSTVVTFLSKKEKNLFCKHVCALCGPAVRGPLVQSVASDEPIKSSFPRPTTRLPLPDRCFPNSRGPRFWGVAEPIRFPFGGEGVSSWIRLGAGFARLSRASLVAWRVVLLTPLHHFFSFSPPPLPDRVLLISLRGCSWRRRSVGNDARSFNYRSRRTSVRKADRKIGRDRVKQEASPRHPSLSSQFGLEVRGNWKVSRIESGWGERPESYRLFAINFFWKPFSEPFLFIVDQPGRESEKVRRERESGGSHGEIAVRPDQEHHAHTLEPTPTCAHPHAHPLPPLLRASAPRARTGSPALGAGVPRAPVPLAPSRAPGWGISSVCPKGDMPFGHVIISTGSETSKKWSWRQDCGSGWAFSWRRGPSSPALLSQVGRGPSRASAVDPAAAGRAQPETRSLPGVAGSHHPRLFLGFRTTLYLSPNLPSACACVQLSWKITLRPLSLSLSHPLLSRAFSVSLPKRDPFWWRPLCRTWETQSRSHRRRSSPGPGPPSEEASEKRSPPGAGERRGSRGVAAGLRWAGGLWREQLRESGLCTCVCCPRPLRLRPPEPAGSDPPWAQPGSRHAAGGRASARGPTTLGLFGQRAQPSPPLTREALPCLPAWPLKKKKKEWLVILKPGARPSRRFLCLAPGRVLPVVQLAIGRSPSNLCLLPGAAAEPTRHADWTRGGRGCAGCAATVGRRVRAPVPPPGKRLTDPGEAARRGCRAAVRRASDSTCRARELKVSDTWVSWGWKWDRKGLRETGDWRGQGGPFGEPGRFPEPSGAGRGSVGGS